MLTKKELTGARLKRSLGLKRASQQWHNKNKRGGNFGINLWIEPRQYGNNYELTGTYNTDGVLTSLRFGSTGQAGSKLTIAGLTYDKLVSAIKAGMERIKAMKGLGYEI